MLELIGDVLEYLPTPLPDESPLEFVFGTHDGPASMAHWEVHQGSVNLAKEGRRERVDRTGGGVAKR
jgi:hypothetical protein